MTRILRSGKVIGAMATWILLQVACGQLMLYGSQDQPQQAASETEREPAGGEQELARELVAALDYQEELSFAESWQLMRLSTVPLSTKLETIRLMLADEESAQRVGNHAHYLAKSVVDSIPPAI